MKTFICPSCGLLEREEIVMKDQTSALCLKCDRPVEIDPVIPYKSDKFVITHYWPAIICPNCGHHFTRLNDNSITCWNLACPLKGLTFLDLLPVLAK